MMHQFVRTVIAAAFVSQAKAAYVIYQFSGVLDAVVDAASKPISSFGTIPVGSQFTGSFSYYLGQNFIGGSNPPDNALYGLRSLTLAFGSDVFSMGPLVEYIPGGINGPPPTSAMSISVTNGTTDYFSAYNGGFGSAFGTLGGLPVGGSGNSIQLTFGDSSGTALSGIGIPGADLHLSQFNSATLRMASGYYLLSGPLGMGSINVLSGTLVPEASTSALVAAGACLVTLRRRR